MLQEPSRKELDERRSFSWMFLYECASHKGFPSILPSNHTHLSGDYFSRSLVRPCKKRKFTKENFCFVRAKAASAGKGVASKSSENEKSRKRTAESQQKASRSKGGQVACDSRNGHAGVTKNAAFKDDKRLPVTLLSGNIAFFSLSLCS